MVRILALSVHPVSSVSVQIPIEPNVAAGQKIIHPIASSSQLRASERCRRCARRAGVVVDLRDDYVGADTADRGVRVETREKIEKVLHVDPETHIAGCEKQL